MTITFGNLIFEIDAETRRYHIGRIGFDDLRPHSLVIDFGCTNIDKLRIRISVFTTAMSLLFATQQCPNRISKSASLLGRSFWNL
jgi:hypothetical protein